MNAEKKILELKKALEEYDVMIQKDREYISEGFRQNSPCIKFIQEQTALKWNEEAHKFVQRIREIIS